MLRRRSTSPDDPSREQDDHRPAQAVRVLFPEDAMTDFSPREEDRRTSIRYPAVVNRGWLGWRDGRKFQCVPARLIDVSTGGCLVAAQHVPPADRTILIRLHGPILPIWYEARVVETRAESGGIHVFRLASQGGCPYELFMAIAYGHASIEASRRQPELPGFAQENRW